LRKGYVYDDYKEATSAEYDLKRDAGGTSMYPLDINEVAQLISIRSYVSIPFNEDLEKVMRAEEVKIFMDKEMGFWIMCRSGENYTIGKLKHNRDGKALPTK
jgi:hypothetical protein